MYVLDALKPNAGSQQHEYRLLCSGALYNGNVVTTDWTKSEPGRRLLSDPAVLLVVSRPIPAYPQELLLRVSVPVVREMRLPTPKAAGFGKIFIPHREVVDDLAALLTLFLRRLITVHSHVRTIPGSGDQAPWHGLPDYPEPIAQVRGGIVWQQRPLAVVTHGDGTQELDDRAPPPVAVDEAGLSATLASLPSLPAAETIVACARLYSQGMQLIEERAEVAYQLFIAAAETLATEALKGYAPTDDEKVSLKKPVYDRARKLGLSEQDSRELALLAAKGPFWTGQKFQRCLEQYTDKRLWSKDELFLTPEPMLPSESEFAEKLKLVYRSRSGALHTGKSLGATAGVGTSPWVPIDALDPLFSGEQTMPPVTWLERVVQMALVNYTESQRAALKAQQPGSAT